MDQSIRKALAFLLLDVDYWHKSGNLEGSVNVAGANSVHRRVDDPPLEAGIPVDVVH